MNIRVLEAAQAELDEAIAWYAEQAVDKWCIADVDLAVMLNRLAMNGDEVPNHLAEYALRQWQRPTVQLWVNQQRPPL